MVRGYCIGLKVSRQSGPMTKVAITIPATINAQLRPISKLCSPFALAKVGVRRRVGDERHDDYSITADQRPRVRLDPHGNRFFPSPRREASVGRRG